MRAANPISEYASLGGLTRAAKYDGRTVTEKARNTFRASFLGGHQCKVCPRIEIPHDLPLHERQRRADALHTAHVRPDSDGPACGEGGQVVTARDGRADPSRPARTAAAANLSTLDSEAASFDAELSGLIDWSTTGLDALDIGELNRTRDALLAIRAWLEARAGR